MVREVRCKRTSQSYAAKTVRQGTVWADAVSLQFRFSLWGEVVAGVVCKGGKRGDGSELEDKRGLEQNVLFLKSKPCPKEKILPRPTKG